MLLFRHKITRLVTVTSWCTQPGPNNYWFLEWVIKPLFLNGVIKNMAVMEKMLEDSDPELLNYTIVRPCRLLEGMYRQASLCCTWNVCALNFYLKKNLI